MRFEKDGEATLIVANDGTKVARIEVFVGESKFYGLREAEGLPIGDAMEVARIGVQEVVRKENQNSHPILEASARYDQEGCFIAFV